METDSASTPASEKRDFARIGTALLFLIGIILFASTLRPDGPDVSIELIIAAVIGGYMAMNIGANDVANNVGPAVGSRALTLVGAIIIAGIFEAAGALIAGGDVVSTVKKGIINPALIDNARVFIALMMAALFAGALWLNLATAFGAPVSTTHAIVGGVLGAGIAAGGVGIANWSQMGMIAASWIISPVIGGAIAAGFLFWIKRSITYRTDMIGAGRRMVPIMVSLMVFAFSTYLIMKGLKKIIKLDILQATGIGLALAIVSYFIIKSLIAKHSASFANKKKSINKLFTIPLIFAAALLSFAHGANDVANAVGPLAAIAEALSSDGVASKAPIPFWVMGIGALGISIGLALFGPKLIKTVGTEITELDQMRAFCIAMAAAITVIIASQLGLPVSSTHIAVGGVFGVGFLREYIKQNYAQTIHAIKKCHQGKDQAEVQAFMTEFEASTFEEKRVQLAELKKNNANIGLSKNERKSLKKELRQELVKRSALMKIAAAWVITVPASGIMAAILFFAIKGIMTNDSNADLETSEALIEVTK
ncbi:inorganic phosphate transporter [bacterium]|nr:inorganic phosphate transporter [bacterium]MDC0270098.1 inorganic phosphate transporter [bacterium]